jgi:hypothetical protein
MFRLRYLLISFFFLAAAPQQLQAQVSSYEELQAAYLYNFAKYIRWPGDVQQFVIGVYGEEPEILEVLESTLKGKRVAGKEIHLKRLLKPEDVTTCHMVYIPAEEDGVLADITPLVSGKSILLVTEEDLTRRGAMISFIVEEDRLRFKLRKDALSQSGLIVSEGLLNLAIVL